MTLPPRTLGDCIQLLLAHGLLADPAAPIPIPGHPVALISCDSQNVVPDTLFICKGAHFKEQYLLDAISAGAIVYLSEQPYAGAGVPCVQVTDVRLAMALLADFFYDHPSAKLNVVGITGTKGKSSTAYYLKYIFDAYLAGTGGQESGVHDGVSRQQIFSFAVRCTLLRCRPWVRMVSRAPAAARPATVLAVR